MRLKSATYALFPMLFTVATSLWVIERTPNPNLAHYLQSAFALATIVALPGGVIYGIFGAWRAANLRSAINFIQNSKRSRFLVLANETVPLLITFNASYLFVLVADVLLAGKTQDPVPWALLALIPSISLAITSFGFFCGLAFPTAYALIASSLTPLLWAGYTVASPVFALHYSTGLLYPNCCRIYEVIDPTSLLLTLILNIAFAALCASLSVQLLEAKASRSIQYFAIAGASSIVIFLSMITIGAHLTPIPISERNHRELTCEHTEPIICTFPQQIQSTELKTTLISSWKSLKTIYPEIPPRIVSAAPSRGEVGVVITTSSTPSEVAYSLAADALGAPSYCTESINNQAIRDSNYRILQNVFLNEIQKPNLRLGQWMAPLESREAKVRDSVVSMPKNQKQTWIHKTSKAVKACNTKQTFK